MPTRREFLKTAAVAMTASAVAPSLLAEHSPARSLVVLQLAGGNDSLNTLVPYADDRYRRLRPTLAINERDLLPLDDRFALHPSLASMKPLVDRGSVAMIDGIGFPSIDRSHFRCQDVWHTADEGCRRDGRLHSGWLARYADTFLRGEESPLTEVAIEYTAPLGLSLGTRRPAVIGDLDRLAVPHQISDNLTTVLREIYEKPSDSSEAEAIRHYGADLFRGMDADATTPRRRTAVTYPPNRLGSAFERAASLLDAHPEIVAIWITVGGFDTHARQEPEHGALLSSVASSITAFQEDLAARAIDGRVLMVAWSEFGRRAAENASQGTDHGKAGIAFVIGSRVRGGLLGSHPDLGRLDDGDLAVGIDFRSLYATVIRRWFDRDPEPVLGQTYPLLDFL